nr:hypothetical protein [Tanacetum cinerariifolium]
MKDIAITELRRKLDLAQREKDNIQLTVDKLKNASKSLNKLIDCQIVDNYKKGLDEFSNKHVGENCDAKTSKTKPKDVANLSTYPSKHFNSFCYDNDDDEDYNFAITPNKPVKSLSIGDEHLDTVPATESDEFIKSSVENLVPIPSESEGESECDVPAHEEFTTFSNVLFDADYEFDSSDDQSFSDEDVMEKIFSNPLFEEEIILMKIDQHHHNVESDLIEFLCIHDSSLIISSKIDSLLDEFAGELALLKSIPPRIDETDCDPEEDIHLIERLLYDNSSPRPPEEFGIENDDYDSERDTFIFNALPSNDTLSLPEIESFHFDIPSFSRSSTKPPDGNTGILNVKMIGDISDQKVPMPKLIMNLVPNQEKSPDLLSHRSLKVFQPSAKCPMMIHGKNILILDVSYFHFYPPLISSSIGELGQAQRPKKSTSWEATHAYQYFSFYFSN